MEKKILEEYLLEKYRRDISIYVSHFVNTVTNNRNVLTRALWNKNERLRRAMVDGLLYEEIILVEDEEVIYKFPWLKKELEGLVDIMEELSSNNHSRS